MSEVKQTEFDFVEQIEKKQDATLQGLVDWCDLTNLIDLGYVANPQNPSNDKRLPVYGITDDQVNLFAMIVWMGEGHSTEGHSTENREQGLRAVPYTYAQATDQTLVGWWSDSEPCHAHRHKAN